MSRDYNLNIRFDRREVQVLDLAAAHLGKPKSETVRLVLDAYVSQHVGTVPGLVKPFDVPATKQNQVPVHRPKIKNTSQVLTFLEQLQARIAELQNLQTELDKEAVALNRTIRDIKNAVASFEEKK